MEVKYQESRESKQDLFDQFVDYLQSGDYVDVNVAAGGWQVAEIVTINRYASGTTKLQCRLINDGKDGVVYYFTASQKNVAPVFSRSKSQNKKAKKESSKQKTIPFTVVNESSVVVAAATANTIQFKAVADSSVKIGNCYELFIYNEWKRIKITTVDENGFGYIGRNGVGGYMHFKANALEPIGTLKKLQQANINVEKSVKIK